MTTKNNGAPNQERHAAVAPIAIVGRACVLPGALSPEALWEHIAAGSDLLGPAPPGRWSKERSNQSYLSDPDEDPVDRTWSDRGGYVEGFDEVFDPEGFGVVAAEIEGLDPLFQWTLHTAREALRDAGLAPGDDPTRRGAVLGNLSFPSASLAAFADRVWRGESAAEESPPTVDPRNRFHSGLPALLLEDALGLEAGAFALDAACASSLYALAFACDRLRAGEADVMLAGAVNCSDDLFIHIGFSALAALSRSGQSRPFHAEADGLVPAEGAAFVALERLEDAVAAGRRIHGVIRGIGLANDGRGKGFLVPASEGQVRAMENAYRQASLSPLDIDWFECHATGTTVGDGTELASLEALSAVAEEKSETTRSQQQPLGSLKSNLGHLITTAGLAGLIKVLEAMRAGVMPPTLHALHAHPALDGSRFRLLTEKEPWPAGEGPRRAAVSAFGFGGNNAHLVVEEWRPEALPTGQLPAQAIEPRHEDLAIVGIDVVTAASSARAETAFPDVLFGDSPGSVDRQMRDFLIDVRAAAIPPHDLSETLAQQLLMQECGSRAARAVSFDRERTGVFIGMGVDADIARYGARWRATESGDDQEAEAARSQIAPRLRSAGVLGTMPNVVANRLNRRLDIGGASCTVSAEELSGLRALELACAALRRGDLDAALVGAIDMSSEAVHRTAARSALDPPRRRAADAAVSLVIKRLADARRDGDHVHAVLSEYSGNAAPREPRGEDPEALVFGLDEGCALTPRFGHSHAASGLLHLAAAALAIEHGRRPGEDPREPWPTWRGARRARVVVQAMPTASAPGKRRSTMTWELAAPGGAKTAAGTQRPGTAQLLYVYDGADRAQVLSGLKAHRSCTAEEAPAAAAGARLVIAAEDRATFERRHARALRHLESGAPAGTGVHFRDSRVTGDLGFVFASAGTAYRGMGGDLLAALPGLAEESRERFGDLDRSLRWARRQEGEESNDNAERLWASSAFSRLHAELTQGLLGLAPQAAIGYSSGESTSLFATGAWTDIEDMRRDIEEEGLYDPALGGTFDAVAEAWRSGPRPDFKGPVEWAVWNVLAPVNEVRAALAELPAPLVHLAIIHTASNCVIAGDEALAEEVVERIGRRRCQRLLYDIAAHVPEVEAWREAWLRIHRRPVTPVPGVRFYSAGRRGGYHANSDDCAQAILEQAIATLDFPRVIEDAWADGVRVFIEHGPQAACSGWIREILGERATEAVIVALDHGTSSEEKTTGDPNEAIARGFLPIVNATGALLAAGVDVNASALEDAFFERTLAASPAMRGQASGAASGQMMRVPAHWPPVRFPEPGAEWMAPAPTLPPVEKQNSLPKALRPIVPAVLEPAAPPEELLRVSQNVSFKEVSSVSSKEALGPSPSPSSTVPLVAAPLPGAASSSASALATTTTSVAAALPIPARSSSAITALDHMTRVHQQFLEQQATVHQRFLETRLGQPQQLPQSQPRRLPASPKPPPPSPTNGAAGAKPVGSRVAQPTPLPPQPTASPKAPATAQRASGREPTGLALDRKGLEIHASGRISEIFGPLFEEQDDYPRQVRMPEPPLLLADRMTGLDAEPGVHGTGTLWTETDVTEDSWYLNRGRMPAGILIESGQADLMLISFMGADLLNKSERVYRLLGCELTFLDDLPRPGETLCYQIEVDGHAEQDGIRLFFFHYDCHVAGRPRIQVRGGQAGFFSDLELSRSAGILWTPEDADPCAEPRLDPPDVVCTRSSFSQEQVEAFAAGRPWDCFGPGFDLTRTHSDTPTIQGGDMLFLDTVSQFDLSAGPWKRGYLRAEAAVGPNDWFFAGHFKGDPCMPGTLMFEGCVQALSFAMAGMGFTTTRDGYRFQPVTGEPIAMRCRGQVTPESRELTYEVFIEEVIAGPRPRIYADLLCTVDGLKAFHARRVGLELVPDWPLESNPRLLEALLEEAARHPGAQHDKPAAQAESPDGTVHTFGYPSLLACAWGRPSKAFGPIYERFDSPRRVPRLPGPPYHFISRVLEIEGEIGAMESGSTVTVEYDVPEDAWYFDDNGSRSMPYAVLLEAALQPCGWLASYVGCALSVDVDLAFRNLDGTGTVFQEIFDHLDGEAPNTLRTEVELTNIASQAGMIIVSFDVTSFVGGETAYTMDTVFGFFPPEALAMQVGQAISDEERALIGRRAERTIELRTEPERYFGGSLGSGSLALGSLALGRGKLRMLDRITGYWPDDGEAGLGVVRGERDVIADDWYFKAHFFQDPVQPGSLGIEAMLQLLQFYVIESGVASFLDQPRFEPIALEQPLTWKYRGQVAPDSERITVTLEVTEVRREEDSVVAVANSSLWCDGLRIYSAENVAVRAVSGPVPQSKRATASNAARAVETSPSATRSNAASDVTFENSHTLDPAVDLWLADHCPTWARPALPMMAIVDLLARGVPEELTVTGLSDVAVRAWIDFEGPRTLSTKAQAIAPGRFTVRLLANGDDGTPFEAASAIVETGAFAEPPQPSATLEVGEALVAPYAAGHLFHGPAFELMRSATLAIEGASALLGLVANGSVQVPVGRLNPGLLDAALHAIPHDRLHFWSRDIDQDKVAYPARIPKLEIFAPTPKPGSDPDADEVRVEVRFDGFLVRPDLPRFQVEIIHQGAVWARMTLIEACFPKGALGMAPPADRRAFLRDKRYVPGLRLSTTETDSSGLVTTRLDPRAVAASDWMPGTMAAIYGTTDPRLIAKKEHLAERYALHPRILPEALPLQAEAVKVDEQAGAVVVRDSTGEDGLALELSGVRDHWRRRFGVPSRWLGEQIVEGLLERYVRRVVFSKPEGHAALAGRGAIFVANHQVQIESILVTHLLGALLGHDVVTMANAKHEERWIGWLIRCLQSFPGISPDALPFEPIVYFDQSSPDSMFEILARIAPDLESGKRSFFFHAAGTRSRHAPDPVTRLSSVFLDLAVENQLPIVPIRFTGGLPEEPILEKLEFPAGHARQDYWIGGPIEATELAALPYAERRAFVLQALNTLGPEGAEERLPDPEFEARVEALRQSEDLPEVEATLRAVLEEQSIVEPAPEAAAWQASVLERLG